jgi:PAS domain S-box-containing protein
MNSSERKPAAIVVNDDPTQVGILAGLLAKEGIEAHAFSGAEAALAAMDPSDPPGLVVTDLYMPGVDGWRFCRLLRSPEYAAFNKVPILIVSSTFAGDHPERIAADVGADAFLSAPVDGKAFTAQAQALLEGRSSRRQPRALIVEDDADLSALLRKTMAGHGYQVDTAFTIRDAESAFANALYDVALLDYQLPDGTSDTLLDTFQAERPDCACLMVTGNFSPTLALDWMKRGAAAFLHKPFAPETLVELCARARRERSLLRTENLLERRTRELRESEEKYRGVFAASPDGIWIHAEDGTILDANETMCRRIGAPRETLIGRNVREFITPESASRMSETARCVLDGLPCIFETTQLSTTGTSVEVEVHERRIPWGDRPAILCISRDITARKRAEEALKASEMRFQEILRNVPTVAVQGYAMDGTVRYWNRASETFYGYTAQEALGRNLLDLIIPAAMRDGVRAGIRRMAETGETVPAAELTLVRKDGAPIPVYSSHARVQLPGRDAELFCIDIDLTTRRQAETEREVLQSQLAQAQKMESIGRLAGGVAHDFNNTLQRILGHAELALDQIGPDEPLRADLEEIRATAQHSADLTRQLLAFARKQTVAPKVLDLNETVAGMLKMLRRLIGENIALVWNPGHELWPVKMDPAQMDSILANLCINARDAIAGVGTIAIETGNAVLGDDYCALHAGALPGQYARLTVSDDGRGMGAETLAHLFEPFFTTKEPGKGTGLGLAAVHGAVTQNLGCITVSSVPDRGTTFHIYLPRHAAAAAPATEDGKPRTVARGRETVLLVEDEPVILGITRRMLENLGYTVMAAATADEAIRLAGGHTGRLDLVMTDVIMPEINGRDLARILLSTRPDTRLLFMSGYTADVIARQGVLEDGVNFIQKPFSKTDLAVKLREVLQ